MVVVVVGVGDSKVRVLGQVRVRDRIMFSVRLGLELV
jgi:hypothetical protein